MSAADIPKPPVDWKQIALDYRAGIKPLRLIAEEHGISHTAVRKRAEKEEWTRDLKARIQAKADLLVSKAAVSKEVSKTTKITEQVVIDSNAQLAYTVRMEHRADLSRLAQMKRDLTAELALSEATLPEKIKMLQNLAEVDERLRKGMREAFGIKPEIEESESPILSMLRRVSGTSMPVVYEPEDA